MRKVTIIAAAAFIAGAFSQAKADNLWIVGDATPYGWNLDQATALLSNADNSALFEGTIYLEQDKNFKFLTQPDWGGLEYGRAAGAAINDGMLTLAKGSLDEGYEQIQVSESGNYHIVVNVADLSATITKSDYQATEIGLCSLFMVGSATPEGWDVMKGTPLYQNAERPYEYSNTANMSEGSFKIATTLKGACSWDAKYWYFRDAADNDKMALNQEGDLQWNITRPDSYRIVANTLSGAISITKATGVESVECDQTVASEYYNVNGMKVAQPGTGLYIRKTGNKYEKVYIQ